MTRPLPLPARWFDHPPLIRAVAASLVALLLLGVAVAVLTSEEAAAPQPQARVEDAATVAASFLAEVTSNRRDQRLRAIRRYVEPTRASEFVEAFDATYMDAGDVGIRATPRAFRYAERSEEVAVVLVWSEIHGGGGTSWQISAVGVARAAARWRVFSFEGTRPGVPPGDQRLEGFQPLERAA